MSENVAVGMITYNPGASVLSRIQETISCGFKIYVFDNSPDCSLIRDFVSDNATDSSMITYQTLGKNVGLGIGLCALCASAYYDGFPSLLFFDQDTVYSEETLRYISGFFQKNIGLLTQYSAVAFNARNINSPALQETPVTDILLAMNSGSLYVLENVRKMNWHNTKFFVDCVDYEFCLSSNNAHFKLGENTITPGFDHFSEQGDERHRLFGRDLPIRPYPGFRIRDSLRGYFKLLNKCIRTGNGKYYRLFFVTLAKYLFVQVYIRIVNLFSRRSRKDIQK